MNQKVTIKQAEELQEEGGRFYNCEGEQFFDANTSSYKYIHNVGFVKLMEDGKLPVLAHCSKWMFLRH